MKLKEAEICFKGNRVNQEGIYFGCGDGAALERRSPSIESQDSLQYSEQESNPGLYLNINGREIKISTTTSLRSGDVIGMRYDAEQGAVSFDLNGFDYGEAY